MQSTTSIQSIMHHLRLGYVLVFGVAINAKGTDLVLQGPEVPHSLLKLAGGRGNIA
jgi:hypothetical protein